VANLLALVELLGHQHLLQLVERLLLHRAHLMAQVVQAVAVVDMLKIQVH
jgi:hypothetical protein